MRKLCLNEVKLFARQFLECSGLDQLCKLVEMDVFKLISLSQQPEYHEFLIPKGNQEFRIIEAPNARLMKVQRKFNFYLQAVYYLYQSTAAYGYIISIRNEISPKNILENAKRHLGKKYMLKTDLKDFFHQISAEKVEALLKDKPFLFRIGAAKTLAALVSYKGRLPMGAPTSPALSNLACIRLDKELTEWCNERQISYTRFADDMTFSTNKEAFTSVHLSAVSDIIQKNGYTLKEEKTTFYREHDRKMVTGLVLNESIDIDREFYDELEKDLTRLRYLMEASIIVKQEFNNETLKRFKQEIQGKINFIGMIEGYYSPEFIRYKQKMDEALHPSNEQLYNRWAHFNYF